MYTVDYVECVNTGGVDVGRGGRSSGGTLGVVEHEASSGLGGRGSLGALECDGVVSTLFR
jgi:hypothetical protein